MGHIDFETYVPSLNYGGVGNQRLRFASVLREHIRGKAIDDPDREHYEELIVRHRAVPILHDPRNPRSRVSASWALLDYHKLTKLNSDNIEGILRPDRRREAEGLLEGIPELEKALRLHSCGMTPPGGRGIESAVERYLWCMSHSLLEKDVPGLSYVLSVVNGDAPRIYVPQQTTRARNTAA